MAPSNRDVFVNCPFDPAYRSFFHAIIFAVLRSGFRPRCTLEMDDASENRFETICRIIAECRYGIHDICRTELDDRYGLPRFNMPLELGLFLGSKRFGSGTDKSKRCIVLDRQRYRYQKFISDISGQDIHSHHGRVRTLIEEVASWLRAQSRQANVPGGRIIADEFDSFRRKVPGICTDRGLHPDELTFGDYADMVVEYVTMTMGVNRKRGTRHG
jgi:hypothetical protein